MTKSVTRMELEDADWYSPEQRDAIVSSYPEHERDARTKGIPTLGAGRVFPVVEGKITCAPFQVPKHWWQIVGMDFGWDHPFAAVRCAHDRESDIWHVTAAYRETHAVPPIHVGAILPWGKWLPCAWPHDGLQHDKGSGDQLASQYRKLGLSLLHEKATHFEGGFGIEAGIMDMLERMQTGRFKVFANLTEWFEEFRLYHRQDGKIVKERDDLISATRYALMMRRFARQQSKPEDNKNRSGYRTMERGAGDSIKVL